MDLEDGQEFILDPLSDVDDDFYISESEEEYDYNEAEFGSVREEVYSEIGDELDRLHYNELISQTVPVQLDTGGFKWTKEDEEKKFTPQVQQFVCEAEKFKIKFDENTTPLQIFQKFLDDEIVENIISETNDYANQIKLRKANAMPRWTPLTKNELWSFLGLQLLSGIIKKPTIKDYWSTDELLSTPAFPRAMCRNRYEDILRSLHFSNNENARKNTSRLHKLGEFLPKLLINFEKAINCGEFLCVDESLLKFKGRLSFKQYIPNKRSKFGIKYFVLVDNETKFVVKIIVYLGKESGISREYVKEYGFGGATVIDLLKDYLGKNHKLVIDNWFNSPKLLKYLKDHNTFGLGTVRKSRKGLPPLRKKIAKGSCECYFTDDLLLERPKSNFGMSCFNYRAISLWNSLPSNIRGASNFINFKKLIKEHLLSIQCANIAAR